MRGESSLANSFSREEALPTECFDFDFSSGVALKENNPQRHPVVHDVASKSGSLKGGEGIVTSQSANVCKREKKVEEWSGREGREGKPATDRFGESVLLFHLTSQKRDWDQTSVRARESVQKRSFFFVQQEEKSSRHISPRWTSTDSRHFISDEHESSARCRCNRGQVGAFTPPFA